MPAWMRHHAATQAAELRQNAAQARKQRLQAAQVKLAAAKQRHQQVTLPPWHCQRIEIKRGCTGCCRADRSCCVW